MSSTSTAWNDDTGNRTYKVNGNDTDDNNPNVDVCGDDDCVIIKVVERTHLHKKCGNKLQTSDDSINTQQTIPKSCTDHEPESNECNFCSAPSGQEQLRRNPKRLAKQLNNRKRRLESKYDFSYIPAHKFVAKRKKILKCAKEIHTHTDSANRHKPLAESKEPNKFTSVQLPSSKQINERTTDNVEEQILTKVRTRSRCTDASEFAPPSPERLWEWREWPTEGMHERPVYQDSLDKNHLQEAAHHALHAVLAFCVMVCSQKTNSGSALSVNDCQMSFASSETYCEVSENTCNSCSQNQQSANDLMQAKEVSTVHMKSPPGSVNQLEEEGHIGFDEASNSTVKINNEVSHSRDQKGHSGREMENILNSSNSSTVSGESGDLIIAENEDEHEQTCSQPVDYAEQSSDYDDRSITTNSCAHLTSVIEHKYIADSSCAGCEESNQKRSEMLNDDLCKWKMSIPVTTRSELHFMRKDMKNLFREEHPKTLNDNVTLEGLQDLINYTALLYCVVCSVPQSALAHYINSLTPSSILDWLAEVSQNMQIE